MYSTFSCSICLFVCLSDIGRVEFSKQWNLCKLIKSQWDVANFKKWLKTMFTTMAMTNYPYPSDFMAPLPANPVKVGECLLVFVHKLVVKSHEGNFVI